MFKSKNNYTALYLTFTLFWGLCYGFVLLSSAAGAGGLLENQLFQPGLSWTYKWESIVLLTEKNTNEKHVGFSISSDILIESKWSNQEKLLKLQIIAPQLHIKSRKAPEPEGFISHSSELDAAINEPFYIVKNNGKIEKILIANNEPLSLINIKKGIASLLQFQLENLETNEIDASGKCKVSYKTSSNQLEKTKTDCTSEDFPYLSNPAMLLSTKIDSSRHVSYKFNSENKYIEEILAKEKHEMYISINEDVGSQVETIQKLKFVKSQTTDVLNGNSIDEILNTIDNQKIAYTRESLLTEKETSSNKYESTFTNAINENRDNLKSNLLGSLAPAKAFLHLVSIARQSNKAEISKALGAKKNQKIMHQIYDILGYTQTMDSHEAVMKKLHFDKQENEELSERYLWSLSMSSHPNPDIINDLLNKFKKTASIPEKVKETLLHTIATMTYRLRMLPIEKRNQKVEKAVEETLLNHLEASKNENRYPYLRALKNLRSENTIPKLLDLIKKGTLKEGVLAWKAIRTMESDKWNKDVIKTAYKTFFQLDKKHDSSSRTLALDILIESNPSDQLLKEILYFLNSYDKAYEVKQYVLQTIKMMADSCKKFNERITNIIRNDKLLNNYSVLAQKGLSTALKRSFVEHSSSNGSLLTMQEMFGGIVKRGVVNVVMSKDGVSQDVFSLGIFSGGLSSFLSSNDAEETADDVATAGMELSMLGTHVRPFVFFTSQGELMGHVWSGTGSEKTSAYQVLVMLQDHSEYLRLGSGFIAELDNRGATSFDLSGKIEFSLWNRNAESLVEKAAGIIIAGLIKVDTSFVKSQIEYNLSIEPKLKLQTDIDFYSNVNLCMRLVQPDSIYKYNIFKIERIPNSKHRLRKVKYKKYIVPGKTYSLNKKNNEMCNVIFK